MKELHRINLFSVCMFRLISFMLSGYCTVISNQEYPILKPK